MEASGSNRATFSTNRSAPQKDGPAEPDLDAVDRTAHALPRLLDAPTSGDFARAACATAAATG